MVRVGGGWDTLEHYLDKHDPCRCAAFGEVTSTKTTSPLPFIVTELYCIILYCIVSNSGQSARFTIVLQLYPFEPLI